ncbi:uncharacterized protein LOC131800725 [Musca domestica]|uniref:Uncharacterized protein LOC131800725 n=1 Tax=Musca domestica TaxID=7370 RepID=A0ABM3ULI3_MUSDO|nr:uncharacterized protein LOC131800725 [Musca domestica]
MAAIVGAFTKHMQSVKTTDAPQTTATNGSSSTGNNNRVSCATIAPQVTSAMVSASANNTASTSTASACTASSSSSSSSTPATGGEYEMFCRHMQKITRLSENDLLTDPSSPPCSMKISITPHTSILDRLSNILNGQE